MYLMYKLRTLLLLVFFSANVRLKEYLSWYIVIRVLEFHIIVTVDLLYCVAWNKNVSNETRNRILGEYTRRT